MAVRTVHGVTPWLVRTVAGSPRGTALRDPERAGLAYDTATVALAAVAAPANGRGSGLLLAAAAGVLGCRPGVETRRARTVLVATAEETIWRDGCLWTVLPFALMHRPVHPRSWPYHLLTGAAFTAAERWGGLTAAAVAHSAHNLWVTARQQPNPADEPAGRGEARPSSSASSAWPTPHSVSNPCSMATRTAEARSVTPSLV